MARRIEQIQRNRRNKRYISNKEIINDLKTYIPNYEKNMNIYPIIEDKTNIAIENSKKLEKEQIRDGKEIININCNPYTSVYKPVEYIINRSK